MWCHPSTTFESHRIPLWPPSLLLIPPSPNHYYTYLDPVPPAIVKDNLIIAYFRFQVGRSVSLGWRFNERRDVVTSKHRVEWLIVRPSHPLSLVSTVSQSKKSMKHIIYLILILIHGFVFLSISEKLSRV